MKLEMMGKLNTEDHLDKYFDEVPEDKKAITLHHLLTHTSRVVDAVGPDYQKLQREELIEKAFKEPLQHSTGEEFAYSNAGYSLLAAIIEKVSGQKYEEFLSVSIWQKTQPLKASPSGPVRTRSLQKKWLRNNWDFLFYT